MRNRLTVVGCWRSWLVMVAVCLLGVGDVAAFSPTSLLGVDPSVLSSMFSSYQANAQKKKVLSVLAEEVAGKALLEQLGDSVNKMQQELESIDERLSPKASDLNLRLEEMQTVAFERLSQVAKLYRFFHDHLYPDKQNDPAIIIEIDEEAVLAAEAFDRLVAHSMSSRVGAMNECSQRAAYLAMLKTSATDTEKSPADILIANLEAEPLDKKLEQALLSRAYYKNLQKQYEYFFKILILDKQNFEQPTRFDERLDKNLAETWHDILMNLNRNLPKL